MASSRLSNCLRRQNFFSASFDKSIPCKSISNRYVSNSASRSQLPQSQSLPTRRSQTPASTSIPTSGLIYNRAFSTSRCTRQSIPPPPPTESQSPPSSAPRPAQAQTPISHQRPSQRYRHASSETAAMKEKNASALYYTISMIMGTVALAYGSVPFYKMICQQTGWGGQPIKHDSNASGTDPSERVKPVTTAKRLRITFNSSTSDILPWTFTPQQREVRVLPGETALAFFTATNNGPEDIIGVATYSVSPGQVSPYFSKIQCFCFEEQRLCAGESVDMPVFFFVDPEFASDPTMKGIETITLSYTFFKAKYDKEGHLKPMPMA